MLQSATTTPTESVTPLNSLRSRKVPSALLSPTLTDHRHHILLIAESKELQQTFQKELNGEFRFVSASTVEEGMDLLERDCPDLIICDLHLKLKYLVESLREAERCDIPLLVMGTETDRKAAAALIGHGVMDLLTLPIEAAELRCRLNSHLQLYLARRTLKNERHGNSTSLHQMAEEIALKTKELDRMNRMKDEFLAMLSHELRNPINVISGFAEVLVDNANDAELAYEAAQTIYRNAQFQAKLIQDLMDVSRSMNGKMLLDCRPLELDHMLEEILPEVERAAHKKDIKLCVLSKCAGLISGDFTRIHQVIWNLLSNAIKFTPEGGKIDIEIRQQGSWIEFAVRDTGVGIDPVFLPHIFEQFHQQDSTITRRFGGLGLGLAIVKNIVELHRGKVKALSEGIGHGATFIVQLPALPN